MPATTGQDRTGQDRTGQNRAPRHGAVPTRRRRDRRPLPALVLIVALAVLTTVVWWRVLHRPELGSQAASTPCPTATALPPPSAVAVTVLNGAGRDRLAASVRTALQQQGFQVSSIGDAPQPYAGVARIDYASGSRGAATLLRYYFPGAQLQQVNSSDRTVVVTLGTAFTAVAPPDAVRRALSQAQSSKAPATPHAPAATATASC